MVVSKDVAIGANFDVGGFRNVVALNPVVFGLIHEGWTLSCPDAELPGDSRNKPEFAGDTMQKSKSPHLENGSKTMASFSSADLLAWEIGLHL